MDKAENALLMWEIATESGYNNAITVLRTAARMPCFQEQASTLLLAAELLERSKAHADQNDMICNDISARDKFLDAAVSFASLP